MIGRAPRGRCGAALPAWALVLLVGTSVTACDGPRPSTPPGPLAAPLATAVAGPGGAWATVALGDTSNPAGTYWQLLQRRGAAGAWTDQVDATATATFGGIGMAVGPGGLVAGVRPALDLTFSPLAATADGGRTWGHGLLPGGLSGGPQSLAAGPAGRYAALLGGRGPDQRVVTSAADLVSWRPLVTYRQVAAALPGCRVAALTAVALSTAGVLVGADCRRGGRVGVVRVTPQGRVVAVDPGAAGVVDRPAGATGVLAFTAGGTAALVATSARTLLVVPVEGPRAPAFDSLHLQSSVTLVSIVSLTDGFLVVTGGTDGSRSLYRSGRAGWERLPPPPPATGTVAALPGGELSALSAAGATVQSWDLAPGGTRWRLDQTLPVPILYGAGG